MQIFFGALNKCNWFFYNIDKGIIFCYQNSMKRDCVFYFHSNPGCNPLCNFPNLIRYDLIFISILTTIFSFLVIQEKVLFTILSYFFLPFPCLIKVTLSLCFRKLHWSSSPVVFHFVVTKNPYKHRSIHSVSLKS